MRNDEKIDIQLAQNTAENLSEEEIAQQNYNTALRYINIAEHMKQFEDQDKYYHRAIKYLKRVRPYMEVRPMIRKLRKKKFRARAEGKISLYKEACKIRDKAKTPNDYYSAQTLFYRIHQYEIKHSIPARRISPELYEEVMQCSDSEQQAIRCGELAAQKAAEQKRHSLIVSIIVIAVIAALLCFTRTTAFRQCLASFYSVIGDHEGAWKAYSFVYEHTEDSDAYTSYQTHRYKAAVKELEKGDTSTAYSDFNALAKDNYLDSGEQLITIEKQLIQDTDLGEIVQFAGFDWRILDKQDNKALLIKDNAINSTPFHEGGGECTWETSSIRTWLNTTFLEENFSQSEVSSLLVTEVITAENPVYHTSGGNDTQDQVFLLSSDEVLKYQDILHKTQTCWWTRTPGASSNSMTFVYRDKTLMDYGYETGNTAITVKPAIWVNLE